MSRKELIKAKQHLAYKIRNIREDYSGVEKDDMPDDVVSELAELMNTMNDIRRQLNEEAVA